VKSLTSSVADIKNWSPKCKAGALVGGAFIDYFVNKSVPWIHMDIASVVYNNDRVSSYGINLLKTFLEKL
jgi:leucyl aminopeptidase